MNATAKQINYARDLARNPKVSERLRISTFRLCKSEPSREAISKRLELLQQITGKAPALRADDKLQAMLAFWRARNPLPSSLELISDALVLQMITPAEATRLLALIKPADTTAAYTEPEHPFEAEARYEDEAEARMEAEAEAAYGDLPWN